MNLDALQKPATPSLPKEVVSRKRRSKNYLIEPSLVHEEIIKQFRRLYRPEILAEIKKLRRMLDDGVLYEVARLE